ncbi:MAG: YhdT family protein [Aeromonas sp.]
MNRFLQARREALYAVLLTLLYFCAWYSAAYFIAPTQLLWGVPLWFVLSCFVAPLLFIGLCALMVRYAFVDMPLAPEAADEI